MIYSLINYSLFVALLSPLVSSHVFRLGECPDVEPMVDFELERFLGEWFIVQEFRTASDCVRENFTKINDNFFVKRSSKPLGSLLSTTISGEIYFPKNNTHAEMVIDYPLSTTGVINLKPYIVLATDYENYALVWNCHKMIVGHRQSAQIMSRTLKLDHKMISELRELLANYDLNEHYFTIVKQKECEFEFKPFPEKPIFSIDGGVDCEKPKPGQRIDKSGIHVRLGPFHFSATLPFK